MRLLIIILFAVALTGCECFPKGEPPKNGIVAYVPSPRSLDTAVYELENSLIAFGLSGLDGAWLRLTPSPDNAIPDSAAQKVLVNAAAIVNFKIGGDAPDYIANSVCTEISPELLRWEMNLAAAAAPDKILWRQAVDVNMNFLTGE